MSRYAIKKTTIIKKEADRPARGKSRSASFDPMDINEYRKIARLRKKASDSKTDESNRNNSK